MIIGIGGGSGSGKSTFTRKLKNAFGDRITVIHHDNYYRATSGLTLEERSRINYDHPDQLETELLTRHLKALKANQPIFSPVYDFTIHNRSEQMVKIEPTPVIIVEGILVLADRQLRELFDLKIFVESDADERILRRIIRDVRDRGRKMEDVIDQYLTTVKPMHNLFVEPTKNWADIIINGGKNEQAFDLVKTKLESILKE